MKKSFILITLLLGLSSVGIIFIQVSWMNNMILIREEQIKHRVEEISKIVGNELAEHLAVQSGPKINKKILADDFSFDIFGHTSVGTHFDAAEIKEKFDKALELYKMKDVPYEFAIASFDKYGNNYFEKMSPNFVAAYQDTSNNNYSYLRGLNETSVGGTQNIGVNEVLFVVVTDLKGVVIQSLRLRIAASLLFTIIIFVAFFLTVRTMIRQKKVNEIKNDFINNMTHEFKTPIATISLAVDAMRNEKVLQDRQKLDYFSGIIKEENLRMNRQVETILKASQLDKQEIKLNKSEIHLHSIIEQVVDNFSLQLQSQGGSASLELNANSDLVIADEVHLTNLVSNLVDNALKYSRENVPSAIKISTSLTGKSIILRIEDNGIGMTKDALKRIFEKFYRAHTGNRHDVKGFGLGLSYVKTVVEAHHGKIKAESVLGKGSTFTIELPLAP